MLQEIILLLTTFAAPIPWWLILVHKTQERKNKLIKTVSYLSIGLFWLIIGYFFFSYKSLFFINRFDANLTTKLIGAIVIALALIIDFNVIKKLGIKKLICLTEMQQKSKAQLVTDGIYKYARHPRYVEYPLWFLGLGLILGNTFLLFFALYVFLSFWFESYFEEAELISRFGKKYIKYQDKTPRFFIKLTH